MSTTGHNHKKPAAVSPLGGRLSALLNTNICSPDVILARLRGDLRYWPDTITDTGVPPEVAGAVREIVRRTGLWNHERVEVARELCNHATEALDAGGTPAGVASGMGDARVIARLIRRSMKRKRHWVWHVRSWVVRSLGAVAAGLVLITCFMTARFFLGDPSPSRNMIAEMNAPFEAYDDDERSWPLLKEAWSTFAVKRHIASEAMHARARTYADTADPDAYDKSFALAAIDSVPRVPTGHPDTDEVMAFYSDIRGELAMIRSAAARPVLGMLYSTVMTEIPVELEGTPEGLGWIAEPLPAPDNPAEQEMVIGVMLPALGPMRVFSKWLAFDAIVRAGDGDGDGAVESVGSVLGLADQVAQDQFLISRLVAFSIEHIALQAVSDMLTDHAEVFTDDHLIRLAHMFSASRFGDLPLESEEMVLDDFLQRAFTDDGDGNGYLTNEGVALLSELEALSAQIGDGIPRRVSIAASLAMVAPRQEQVRVRDRVFAQLRREEDAGYEIYRRELIASDAMVVTLDEHRYRPLTILLPALGRSLATKLERRTQVEACLIGIASELYKRQTGEWPGTVADLVPRSLPEAPEDPFTGGDLRLAVRDGRPVVYAVGPDGDDDGGTLNGNDHRGMRPRPGGRARQVWDDALGLHVADVPDGDWVLYPVP